MTDCCNLGDEPTDDRFRICVVCRSCMNRNEIQELDQLLYQG
jgi:hypothetical protein